MTAKTAEMFTKFATRPLGEISGSERNSPGRRPDFAARVYDLVTPGTTIVVTDAPALPVSSFHREALLMKAEQK